MIQRLLASANSLETPLSEADFLYDVGDNSSDELANRLMALASRADEVPHAVSLDTQATFLKQLVWTTRAKAMDQRLEELI